MTEALVLDASLFCNMAIGRHIKDSEAPLSGVEFSDDGALLVSYTADTLHVYDMVTGRRSKTLRNAGTRIAHLRFTHSPTAVVFVPQLESQDLLVWSIYENEVVKSFRGPPNATVLSLCVNPTNDWVLTADSLATVRVYDLAADTPDPLIVLTLNQPVEALVPSFDHLGEGLFLASTQVGQKSSQVVRYRVDGTSFLPLSSLKLTSAAKVVALKPDFHGKTVAVSNEKNVVMIATADLKKVLYEIRLPPLKERVTPEFSYSPDSKFLLNGEEDGTLKIYDVEKGAEIARYSNHVQGCLCVKFSPTHVLFASACKNLILWIPKFWDKV